MKQQKKYLILNNNIMNKKLHEQEQERGQNTS